jgi:hypothetical protein
MPIPSFRVPVAVALALLLSTSASFAQASRGQTACDTLRQLQVPGADLSEVKTEWVAAGAPCRLRSRPRRLPARSCPRSAASRRRLIAGLA